MVAVPGDIPATIPVAEPTPTVRSELLHTPPPVPYNVVVKPTQTLAIPIIGVGDAYTVTILVTVHPVSV